MSSRLKSSCFECSQPIGNELALLVADKILHLKHFKCHFCSEHLQTTDSFHVLSNGKTVCLRCYALRLAPKCAKCGEGIIENGVRAAEQDWHASCLRCAKCQGPLVGSFLHNAAGDPVDYACYWGDTLQQVVAQSNHK